VIDPMTPLWSPYDEWRPFIISESQKLVVVGKFGGRRRRRAILISHTNPDLVCTDEANGVTVHYKINHSMFSRAWLLDVTYKLPIDDPATLGDFPGRLNVAGEPMKHGFEACFQSGRPRMAAMPIRFFFPWETINPQTRSRVNPGAPFASVIPKEEIGMLFDDITLCSRGVGSETGCENAFPELTGMPANFEVGPAGIFSSVDAAQDEIRRHIESGAGGGSSKIPGTQPVPVPIGAITRAVLKRLPKRPVRGFQGGDDEQWYEDLKKFVVDLNGPPLFGSGRYVWQMYRASLHVDRDVCRQLIRLARQEVAKEQGIRLEDDSD
jgi:hypothetical protein